MGLLSQHWRVANIITALQIEFNKRHIYRTYTGAADFRSYRLTHVPYVLWISDNVLWSYAYTTVLRSLCGRQPTALRRLSRRQWFRKNNCVHLFLHDNKIRYYNPCPCDVASRSARPVSRLVNLLQASSLSRPVYTLVVGRGSYCSGGRRGPNGANCCRPRSITRHNYRPENGFLPRLAENDNVFGIFVRPARPRAIGQTVPRRSGTVQ